jgi:hypothetical protein
MTTTKTAGLGDNLYVGGYDLSGDVNSIGKISCVRDVLDFTVINEYANERQVSLKGGEIDITSFFEASTGGMTPVGVAELAALPRTDTIMTYFRGQALQNPAACLVAKQLNYDPTRGTDASLTLAITGQANGYGLEWGEQLTAGLRTDLAATIGPAITDAAATTYGGQAYFQVIAFTGTSVTIDIQQATTSGGTYATTGLTSQAFTAPGAQRVAVSNTTSIDQYLKVVTTGTFSHAVFAVAFMRNQVAGVVF